MSQVLIDNWVKEGKQLKWYKIEYLWSQWEQGNEMLSSHGLVSTWKEKRH